MGDAKPRSPSVDTLAALDSTSAVVGTVIGSGQMREIPLNGRHGASLIRPNISLNLGLRYEYYGVNREVNDRYRVFDLNACRGFCPQGTPWYFPDRNNFDPRFGLAWSIGKTVIRTGAGIYHGPGQIDDVNTALDNTADRYSLTAVEAPGLAFPVAPFLALAQAVGVTPRSLQRDRRDLYSAQWGLSVQRQLPASFLGQIGYTGSSGVKLFARQYINNIDPVARVRPLPTFGRLDEKRQDGKSNFHAMQISLPRRVARRLNWGSEYMWSHSINDGNLGGSEGAQPQIASCRRCDRGNSAEDIRRTITSNWMYELPFGPGQKFSHERRGLACVGGWETSGIWTARTGRMPDGDGRVRGRRGSRWQHYQPAAQSCSGRAPLSRRRPHAHAVVQSGPPSRFRPTAPGATWGAASLPDRAWCKWISRYKEDLPH